MKKFNKSIPFLLLLAALVLVNFIGGFTRGQVDLTENELFTLSEGSRSLLAKIEEPVTLQFYFSRSVEALPTFFKNYATRVEDLLRQYEKAADGKIRLEVIDPQPDTPEEEAAIRAGLPAQPLPSGETLFFGLLAIQADQEALIPVFTRQREPFLEFDISQIIHEVQQLSRPRLGIVSSLPILADPMPVMGRRAQQPSDWIVAEQLRNQFDIEPIDGDNIPDGIDVLAVIHPQDLSDALLYEIDQFVLSGKPAFIAVDPSSFVQKGNATQMQMMGRRPPTSSDLPTLFESWGIDYDASMAVGDLEFAANVSTGAGPSMRYPVWLNITEFSDEAPVTAQLSQMLFPEAGSFSLDEDSALELTPLIQTSARSGEIMTAMLGFGNPEQISRQIEADETQRVIAGLVRGTFESAFPDGRPEPEEETEATASDTAAEEDPTEVAASETEAPEEKSLLKSENPGTVFLITDTDFLADDFSVRILNLFGTRGITPLNDNLAFTSNVMDYLAGSKDLIGLRSKGTSVRPFERVREIETAAQEQYEARLVELESRLQEVQAKLRELQQQQTQQGKLVASDEVRETIQGFRVQEAEMRSERREIRAKLREDIESLKVRLALGNLLIVPALVGLFGINFFLARSRRHKRERSKK